MIRAAIANLKTTLSDGLDEIDEWAGPDQPRRSNKNLRVS
jgi:hypothetical protein